MKHHKFSAIILAAGFSARMEAFKPLLRIGGQALVEHAIALFRTSGVDDIVTVVGHRATELLPVVQAAGSRGVLNADYTAGMYSSVQTGVRAVGRTDAFFLLPVDIPLVRPATVRSLAAAFEQHSAPPVCYPLFRSARGHPPLINRRLRAALLRYDGKGGLREFLRRYETHAIAIPVEDPFIHMDADTPQDFLKLEKMMPGRN